VLGGQHIAKAMLEIGAEMAAEHRPVPHTLSHVRARVLKVDTPEPVRRAAAGDHQFAQQQVSHLKLSDIARLLLRPDIQAMPRQLDRLASTLRMAGHADRTKPAVCDQPSLPLPWTPSHANVGLLSVSRTCALWTDAVWHTDWM
jgi:hypothetical protein